ncbi:MAG: calcium/sodium antiporter [Snowella sp.]|nr:calcium/sodium antiporter [Snowella sp.]
MGITTILILIAGLVLLVAGAEVLVKGASRIAFMFGLSPLVIGLTIVAYGTSSPELMVSIQSSLAGQPDIALGNVVGSNIFNVLLILGISALITPLVVAQQLIRLDVPILIGISCLTLMFGMDGKISRVDGAIFVIGILLYTTFLLIQSRKEHNPEVTEEYEREYGGSTARSAQQIAINIGFVVLGLGLLVLGSKFLVDSSIAIARSFGVSELVIGLTLVAAGTSLPELATSVVASVRGERDIAVGNVIGSNIFNILAVLGGSSLFSSDGLTVSASALRFDIPVMIAVAVICFPVFITGQLIARWEGLLFLSYYVAYTAYLIMDSANYETLPIFSNILLFVVFPATILSLGVSFLPSFRKSR